MSLDISINIAPVYNVETVKVSINYENNCNYYCQRRK